MIWLLKSIFYFSAGADIKEMVPKEFSEVFGGGFLENWTQVTKVRKPVIAAVNGHALGGGCEVKTHTKMKINV